MGTSGCYVYSQLYNGPIRRVKNSSSDLYSGLVQAAAADSWIDPVKRSPFLGTGPSHVSPKPGCADWDKGYSQGWCPPESRLPTTVSSPASVPSCLFCCPSLASLPGSISPHSISSVRLSLLTASRSCPTCRLLRCCAACFSQGPHNLTVLTMSTPAWEAGAASAQG